MNQSPPSKDIALAFFKNFANKKRDNLRTLVNNYWTEDCLQYLIDLLIFAAYQRQGSWYTAKDLSKLTYSRQGALKLLEIVYKTTGTKLAMLNVVDHELVNMGR